MERWTVHCTLNTAHSTMNTAHCTLHIAHWTWHTVLCTLHSSKFKVHNKHCMLDTEHWTLYRNIHHLLLIGKDLCLEDCGWSWWPVLCELLNWKTNMKTLSKHTVVIIQTFIYICEYSSQIIFIFLFAVKYFTNNIDIYICQRFGFIMIFVFIFVPLE